MKKLLSIIVMGCAAITGSAQAQGIYQFEDPGFEKYTSGNEPGFGWNSFASATGGMATVGKGVSPNPASVEEGANGSKRSVKLCSKRALVAKANGNMTTGVINMGNVTPADPSNHNFTNIDDPKHSLLFAGRPDAVTFYAKFKAGKENKGKCGNANFILHDNCKYRDPEDGTQEANKIGKASILIKESTNWVQYQANFEYKKAQTDVQYLLASVTTNPVPGESIGDELYFDEVNFIYYSTLESLSYAGTNLSLKENIKEYDLSSEIYDETKLSYQTKGAGATATPSFDKKTGVLTLTVKGNDYTVNPSNVTVYKLTFKKPIYAEPVVTEYTNDLTVTINNTCTAPQSTTIQLVRDVYGSYSFVLNRFTMTLGGATMPIGDIKLTNLNVNGNSYQKEQVIKITASDNGYWMGPHLGDIPVNLNAEVNNGELIADINIDMTATLGQIIKVIIAPTTTINDGASFNLENGLNNIALKRNFPAGWNTICLPFAASASSFTWSTPDGYDSYYVKIQKFSSADANGLTFTELQEGEMMEANKPYLIYFPADKNEPTYFGVNVTSTTPVAVSNGDWSFIGTYTGLKAGEMTGKYGVMTNEQGTQSIRKAGAGASIKGTRAYFEYNGTANINSIKLNLEGETTGIDCIENGQLTISQFPANIYSLDGRLVKANANDLKGLSKGIYVVNGKKIIVK